MSCAYTRTDIYWVPVHRVVPLACSVTYGTKLISIPCERREITIVRAFRIGSGSPETLLGRWWLLLTASRWSCNWRLMGHRVFAITRVYTLAINAPCFPTSLEDFFLLRILVYTLGCGTLVSVQRYLIPVFFNARHSSLSPDIELHFQDSVNIVIFIGIPHWNRPWEGIV